MATITEAPLFTWSSAGPSINDTSSFPLSLAGHTPTALSPLGSNWSLGYSDENTTGSIDVNQTMAMPPPAEPSANISEHWPVILLTIVAAICVSGNTAVLAVVGRSSRLHVLFYFFLASLAMADILRLMIGLPISITRLLIGDAGVPAWACTLWQCIQIGSCSLSLVHLGLATLHCHLALYRPLQFRQFTSPTFMITQLLLAWILPILLNVPYTVLSIIQVRPLQVVYSCVPMDYIYVAAGLGPTYLLPIVFMVAVYVRVAFTIKDQKDIVSRLKSEHNSDISSNGFVTFENSLTSEEGLSNKPMNGTLAQLQNGSLSHVHVNDKSVDGSIGVAKSPTVHSESELINPAHVLLEIPTDRDGENQNTEKVLEIQSKFPKELTDGAKTPEDATQKSSETGNDNNGSMEGHQTMKEELPREQERTGCSLEAHLERSAVNAEDKGPGMEPSVVPLGDEAPAPEGPNTYCEPHISVVHVKTKVGKEALNEPLDGNDMSAITDMTSKLLTEGALYGDHDNPTFDVDPAEEHPLSESIKVKKASVLDDKTFEKNILNVEQTKEHLMSCSSSCSSASEGTMVPNSRNSSFGAADIPTGHRSILKRDGSKRNSNKSVKFSLPPGQDHIKTSSVGPRKLSCRYKVRSNAIQQTNKDSDKKSNKDNVKQKIQVNGHYPLLSHMDVTETLKLARENLEKGSSSDYLAQAQRSQSLRLSMHINIQKTNAQLLLVMSAIFLAGSLPYVIASTILSFCTSCRKDIAVEIMMVLEWLTFSTALINPFLYLIFCRDFTSSLVSAFSLPKFNLP